MNKESINILLELDFPKVEIVTEEMQRAAFKQVRLFRGNVRLFMGRLSTTAELEDRRARARTLPVI